MSKYINEVKDEELSSVNGGKIIVEVGVYDFTCPFCDEMISTMFSNGNNVFYSTVKFGNCPKCSANMELINSSQIRFTKNGEIKVAQLIKKA